MTLFGRSRIFCFEKQLIEQLGEVPRDCFVARDGLKPIEDLEAFASENPNGFFSISLKLRGGKGGFGTLLKSFRINKSSNQLMCRDLSGRRLADVEEEKKLKKWIETAGDREKEKETKEKAKLEKLKAATQEKPKHLFNDPDYIRAKEEILDKTDAAFEDGFANLRNKKRKPEAAMVEEESSSDEEDDQPGTSASTFRRAKRERLLFAEQNTPDASPKEESPVPEEEEEVEEEEKEEEKKEEEKVEVVVEKVEEKKKVYEKPTDIPTDFPAVELESVGGVEELEALGLYHLKHALEARGLKCGGSLQERAARLWSVKGIKKEDYPKSIVAAPPKKGKK